MVCSIRAGVGEEGKFYTAIIMARGREGDIDTASGNEKARERDPRERRKETTHNPTSAYSSMHQISRRPSGRPLALCRAVSIASS